MPSFCRVHPSDSTTKFKRKSLYYILWVLVNVICAVCSIYFIKNAYDNWQSSPVVQALSNSHVNLKNISFPAVTVCWPNSFNPDYNYSESITKCLHCENNECDSNESSCDNKEMAILALANQLCNYFDTNGTFEEGINKYVPGTIDADELEMYLENLQPSCQSDRLKIQVVVKSLGRKTRKTLTRCNGDVFQQFYSNNLNKLCMTYNGLKHESIFKKNVVSSLKLVKEVYDTTDGNMTWSFDNMMDFKGGLNTVPIHGQRGLFMIIYRQNNHQKICKPVKTELGSMMVHSPNEIPFDLITDYVIRENVYYVVTLEPKIIISKDNLAQYPPEKRGCFFAHEKYLAMFKSYTKFNCEFECLINGSLDDCGCLNFNFPRPNASVKVCLQPCPYTVADYECGCLPDCNSLSYGVSITESGYGKEDDSHAALIWVQIRDHTFYAYTRYSIMSNKEFLAYSLGILGAFLGLSVTCVWKLFYFGLVKLWKAITSPCTKI